MIIVRPSVHEPVGRVLIRILQNGVVRFMLDGREQLAMAMIARTPETAITLLMLPSALVQSDWW